MKYSEAIVPRHVSTVFSDDLREEVGGKLTVVGVYQSAMLVESFPATIAKLSIWMTAVTPSEKPFKSLIFKIYQDEMELCTASVSEDDLARAHAEAEDSFKNRGGVSVVEMQFIAGLGPITFEGPCILRSRLETDDGIYGSRSLSISLKSENA